jgi:hypothetical protein
MLRMRRHVWLLADGNRVASLLRQQVLWLLNPHPVYEEPIGGSIKRNKYGRKSYDRRDGEIPFQQPLGFWRRDERCDLPAITHLSAIWQGMTGLLVPLHSLRHAIGGDEKKGSAASAADADLTRQVNHRNAQKHDNLFFDEIRQQRKSACPAICFASLHRPASAQCTASSTRPSKST